MSTTHSPPPPPPPAARHSGADVVHLCALASLVRKGATAQRAIADAERRARRRLRAAAAWAASGVDVAAVLLPALARVTALVRRIERALGADAVCAARRALSEANAAFAAVARADFGQCSIRSVERFLADAHACRAAVVAAALDAHAAPPHH